MVIWNSALSIVMKLPLLFIPLLNTIATFYYENDNSNTSKNRNFDTFWFMIYRNGLINLMPVLDDWLFILQISIQLFVYVRVDKKIKTGLDRLINNKSKLFLFFKI